MKILCGTYCINAFPQDTDGTTEQDVRILSDGQHIGILQAQGIRLRLLWRRIFLHFHIGRSGPVPFQVYLEQETEQSHHSHWRLRHNRGNGARGYELCGVFTIAHDCCSQQQRTCGLLHIQMRISFPFLLTKNIHRFLLLMRSRSSSYGE